MKTKIILTIILTFLGLCATAQIQGYRAVYYVPYKSTTINRSIIQGTQVYTDSAGVIEHYLCIVPFGYGVKLSTAISSNYVRKFNAKIDTLFLGATQMMITTGKLMVDSTKVKRILVTDTLQGVVLYNRAGVKYRLRVSPTGVLTCIAVP